MDDESRLDTTEVTAETGGETTTETGGETTTEIGEEATIGPGAEPTTETTAALALAQEALRQAHGHEAIAELITGSTPDELRASVVIAKAAFDRAVEAVRSSLGAAARVPAGAPARTLPINLDSLSPTGRIAYALGQRDAK